MPPDTSDRTAYSQFEMSVRRITAETLCPAPCLFQGGTEKVYKAESKACDQNKF